MSRFIYLILIIGIAGSLYGQAPDHERDSYKALTLKDAIEIGLKNNPTLQSSLARLAASRGRFWSSISLPPPEISITNEYIPSGMSLKDSDEKTVGIGQGFEFPTTYFFRGRKGSTEQAIVGKEYEMNKWSVVAQIKSAYFLLLAEKNQYALAQENLLLAEDFYQKAQIRYQAGEATHLEQLTAKVQYSEAKNGLEISKNRLTTVSAELNNAMGFGKDQPCAYHPVDSLSFMRYDFSLDDLLKEAGDTNPQLQADRLRIGSASFDRKLAFSTLLPTFAVSYFRQSRDRENGYYGAAVGISVPLWFMFDQRGKIEEATANLSLAESDFRSSQNGLLLKIKSSFAELKNQENQVILWKSEIMPQADEIYRAAQKSYEMGEITYIEFIQAKQTSVNAKKNYIDSLLSYHLSVIALEQAIGKPLQ